MLAIEDGTPFAWLAKKHDGRALIASSESSYSRGSCEAKQ